MSRISPSSDTAKLAATQPDREFLEAVRAIVGDRGLLIGDDVAMRSCDPFRNVPPQGAVIVRPANTSELSDVMMLCHRRRQRVVTHGGRTGVSGGAYVSAEEIIVSLERMTAIEEVCPLTGTASVQAGATLQAVQEATEKHGMVYPLDLGSKGTATIGGMIATNAGGNRVLRWGMTRQNILGLEAVLADGTIVSSMNRLVKNNTGYDVKQLFIGAEGITGIVTRAVLKLVPAPVSRAAAFISVASEDNLLKLLSQARRLASLSAFEVMWPDYYDLICAGMDAEPPVPGGQYAYVLIEALGYDETYDALIFDNFLEGAFDDGVIKDAVVATSDQQIASFWKVREGAEIIVREMSPFVSSDISVDIRLVEELATKVRERLKKRYAIVKTATFGHLGDNNIHLAIHVGPQTVEEEDNVETILFDIVGELDGAITAEHGIGQLKRKFLPEHKHSGEMKVMRAIKQCLDPHGLLNHDVML